MAAITTSFEEAIWKQSAQHGTRRGRKSKTTQDEMSREIEKKYQEREQTIITESNRERIPLFVKSVIEDKNIRLRPVYQRRSRWTHIRQSRLIESFIMNVPVPPIFLYEIDDNVYEVVDGQQRVTALIRFYQDQFALKGLRCWEELNLRKYSTLPPKLRAAIDRRTIASVVLRFESAKTKSEEEELKQEVFERLNTGGVHLGKQEIRNSLYQSDFNQLIRRLAREDDFAQAWGIPPYIKEEDEDPATLAEIQKKDLKIKKKLGKLFKHNKYMGMVDVELVLRFFALRYVHHLHGSLDKFLDSYMRGAMNFSKEQINQLGELFRKTLDVAVRIYEAKLFRPYIAKKKDADGKVEIEKGAWAKKAYIHLYDAVMVGISRHLDYSELLISHRERIVESTKLILTNDVEGIFVGAGKRKDQIEKRINIIDQMLTDVIRNIAPYAVGE